MRDDNADSDTTPARIVNMKGAMRRLGRSDEPPSEIDAKLSKLITMARARGQEQELLGALLTTDVTFFSTMALIQTTLLFAESVGRADEFLKKFDVFHEPNAAPPLWSAKDRKKVFGKQARMLDADRSLVKQLISLKYAQGPSSFDDPKAAAAFYALRLDLPEALIDGVYETSQRKQSDKAAFALRLKEGFVFEHVLTDLPRRGANRDVRLPLMGRRHEDDWALGVFQKPAEMAEDLRRPAMFLTIHGSVFSAVKTWYNTVFPDGERIGVGASKNGSMVSSRDNANGALLESYRSLMQGKSLLIAADSPAGTAKNLLSVLGREVPVADGFIFLAYESKAQVFWIIVVEENGLLTPRVVAGPIRADVETMAAYRERLIAFVEQQITAYLVGEPQQICLGSKWIGLMSGNDLAYKERYYRPV